MKAIDLYLVVDDLKHTSAEWISLEAMLINAGSSITISLFDNALMKL
jgi:hypothetical protein